MVGLAAAVSHRKGHLGYREAFRRSKDPPSFMVLFEDSAALLGILIAALGTWLTVRLHAPVIDGIASILIGMVLGGVAILLARECKSLLIGERADRSLSASILRIAGAEESIARANGLLTVQLAPDQVLALLSLEFADDLRAPEIEDRVIEIERKIRAAHPKSRCYSSSPRPTGPFATPFADALAMGHSQ